MLMDKPWMVPVAAALLMCTAIACAQSNTATQPPARVLEHHRQNSAFTDPGRYAFLYSGLPESIDDLCALIQCQLIHPFDLNNFQGQVPEDRTFEDHEFPTVEKMLEALIERDKRGLVLERTPEDRLVVACVHHSMLFASMMRHRGIPVRIRAGFATYIGGDTRVRVSHVVCEVWSAEKHQWILVDPDRNRVDFPRSQFEFANHSWNLLRENKLKKERYISRDGRADRAVLHLLCHDLSYIIGEEMIYWIDPPVVDDLATSLSDIDASKIAVLDQLAGYLENPDAHLTELIHLQSEHTYLQYEADKQLEMK